MRPNYHFFVLILLWLFACDNNANLTANEQTSTAESGSNRLIEEPKEQKIIVDKIYIGMNIDSLENCYPNAVFIEEPVYEYGVDGESLGIKVMRDDLPLLFVWTLEGENRIHGITILSNQIYVDGNVHVGMTVEEFLKKYPSKTFAIDMIDDRYEFAYHTDPIYRAEFLTTDSTRVCEYDFDAPEPEFIRVIKPKSKIDRISF